MRATTRGARRLRVPVILFLLLAAALVLRVASLGMPGHASDVAVIAQWAEALAANGPEHFYDAHRSVYPALLFMYWPLGVVFDGDALHLAIKASSIPFDMALGILLFVVVRGVAGSAAGLAAATIYLLNPAVLIDGPIWGQIDAAGTLVFLGALLAICLSLAFAASLLYQLGTTSPAAVPPALRAVLLTPASVWVQGIVLAASAVAAIWLMVSGAGERLRARS